MKSFNLSVLATLAAGMLASSAAQASNASATISHVQIQLVDLDLSDGITPAIQFASPSTLIGVNQLPSHENPHMTLPTMDSIGPLAVDTIYGSGSAQSINGGLLSAVGWSSITTASAFLGRSVTISVVEMSTLVTLTPNTLMLMSADVPTMEVHIDANQRAQAQIGIALTEVDSATAILSDHQVYLQAGYGADTGAAVQHLQASFANLANTPLEARFWAYTFVRAIDDNITAPPVPEPRSSALLLAGLVGMGALMRRRTTR